VQEPANINAKTRHFATRIVLILVVGSASYR